MHRTELKEQEQEKVILVSDATEIENASPPQDTLVSDIPQEADSTNCQRIPDSTAEESSESSNSLSDVSQRFLDLPNVAGKYQLICLLGEGGMSRVYKARDINTGKVVALKQVLPERLQDEKSVERFIQECKVVETLSHRNIAAINEFGIDESNGTPYLSMEFVDGLTLADLVKQEGAVDIDRALQILLQIADGLSYAHERGVIHRDIKPSNVIVTRTSDGKDRVQIVDFGIARVFDHLSSAHMPLTQTGEALGTPWYMSPEQCFGKIADERSDIYQIGCLLQELLTGKRAFEGETAFEVMFKHVTGIPSLEGIDSNLQEILSKTLSKNPEDRYQSVQSLAKDLHDYSEARIDGAVQRSLLKQVEKHSVYQITSKRVYASAIDAAIIGFISGYLTLACTYSSLYRYWPSYNEPNDRVIASGSAFLLSSLNSVTAWPSIALSLIPYRFIWDTPWAAFPGMREANSFSGICVVPLLTLFVTWLYFAIFESSKLRGTPGKIIFGLKIQTSGPQRPKFWQSSQRFFLKALSSSIVPELIRAVFGITKKGRTKLEQLALQMRLPIHDNLSKCVVVKADRQKERKIIGLIAATFLGLSVILASPWFAISQKICDPVIALNPAFAPAYEVRGDQELEAGNYTAAARDFERVEQLAPERLYAFQKHITALVLQGKFDEALKVSESGLKNAKTDNEKSAFLQQASLIMAQTKENPAEAVKLMQQIQGRNLDRQMLALLMEKAGQQEDANMKFKLVADSINRSIESTKDQTDDEPETRQYHHMHPEDFLNRALLYIRDGESTKAMADLNRSLDDLEFTKNIKRNRNYFNYLAVEGPAHLLKGQLHSKAENQTPAREQYEAAVKGFTQFIERTEKAKLTTVAGVYDLGQAYLGRAEAYRLLGKENLAKRDMKTASDLGVKLYLGGLYPYWYSY